VFRPRKVEVVVEGTAADMAEGVAVAAVETGVGMEAVVAVAVAVAVEMVAVMAAVAMVEVATVRAAVVTAAAARAPGTRATLPHPPAVTAPTPNRVMITVFTGRVKSATIMASIAPVKSAMTEACMQRASRVTIAVCTSAANSAMTSAPTDL
jgi:hypothetical protein